MPRTLPSRTMARPIALSAALVALGLATLPSAATGAVGMPAPSARDVSPVVAVQYSSTVADLQQGLNQLGYDAGPVDGLMGARTRGAIEAYQRQQGLLVTGQVSAGLLAHVQATLAQQAPATPPAPAAPEMPVAADAPSQLIIDIQAGLRRLGYDVPAVTGTLDATTAAAIRAYERDQSLLVTGSASEPLRDHIEDRVEAGGEARLAQAELVRQIQTALNARGYDAGPADGVIGTGTRNAIRTYQADTGLSITGEPSPALLEQLRAEVEVEVEVEAEPAPRPEPQPVEVVVIDDDFSGNGLAGRWRTLQGDFAVRGGELRSSVPVPTGPADTEDLLQGIATDLVRNVLGQALGADLSQPRPLAALHASASLRNAFAATLEVDRAGDAGTTFAVGPTQAGDANIGYRLLIRPGQDLRLMAFGGGDARLIASTGQTLAPGGGGTLKWSRDGDGRMRVELNGTTVIDTSDRGFSNAFDGIVMVNYAGDWRIDSVLVTTPGG